MTVRCVQIAVLEGRQLDDRHRQGSHERTERPMTAHDHRTVVPGCFRCELSADEAMTPHQAIADEFLGATVHSRQVVAQYALDALSAAGYQVVPDNLVEATSDYLYHVSEEWERLKDARAGESEWAHWESYREALFQQIAACLAQHRGDDPLNVFRPEGA